MAYVLTSETKSVLTINGLLFVAITVYTIYKNQEDFYENREYGNCKY